MDVHQLSNFRMHLGPISDWSDQVIALRVCGKIAVFDAMPSSLKKPARRQKRPLARSHVFSSTSSTIKKKPAAAKRPSGIASTSSLPPMMSFPADNDDAYFHGNVCSDCWMPLGGVANYLTTYQSCVRCGQNICFKCVARYNLPKGLCTHHCPKSKS